MTLIKASAKGGKASEAAAWSPAEVPGENDDVEFVEGSGNIEVAAETHWRSLQGTPTATAKLTTGAGVNLILGGAAQKGDKYILKWQGSGTIESNAKLQIAGHSGITELVAIKPLLKTKLVFEKAGKWEFTERLETAGEIEVVTGELKTGNFEMVFEGVPLEVKAAATMEFGTSRIVTNAAFTAILFVAGATIHASMAIFELNNPPGPSKNVNFQSPGLTFGELITSCKNLEIIGSNTFEKGIEIRRPAGGEVPEIAFRQATTQTVSKLINGSGLTVRLVSGNATGKEWKIASTGPNITIQKAEIETSHAGSTTPSFTDIGGKDLGGNVNWKFIGETAKEKEEAEAAEAPGVGLFGIRPKTGDGVLRCFTPGIYQDHALNYAGNGTMTAYFLTNWEPFAYYIFRHRVKAPFLKKRVRQIFFNGEGQIIPAVFKDFSRGERQEPAVVGAKEQSQPELPVTFNAGEEKWGEGSGVWGEKVEGTEEIWGGEVTTGQARIYSPGVAFTWSVGWGNNSAEPFIVDSFTYMISFRKS